MHMTNVRQNIGNKILTVLSLLCMAGTPVFAKGAGSSAGLTLIEAPSARATSMGQAFSAMTDDIAAFAYNPATLKSMKSGQASFLYQKDVTENTFGRLMMGAPTKSGTVGVSLGYFNAGTIDLYDGVTERSVNAQTDLALHLGYARALGNLEVGFAVKYLSSTLIESAKATAFAGDLGLTMALNNRMRLGVAMQNYGTQLKYANEGEDLPRIFRSGLSLALPTKAASTLLLEAPYYMNEEEIRPALGLEVKVGVLALRGGYRVLSRGTNEFSLGTGVMMGKSSLDYSFGLANQLNPTHHISLSFRFGDAGTSPMLVKKKKEVKEVETAQIEPVPVAVKYSLGSAPFNTQSHVRRRLYTVKNGDSLASIAQKVYGKKDQWKSIYTANKHLLTDPTSIEVGQKLILP